MFFQPLPPLPPSKKYDQNSYILEQMLSKSFCGLCTDMLCVRPLMCSFTKLFILFMFYTHIVAKALCVGQLNKIYVANRGGREGGLKNYIYTKFMQHGHWKVSQRSRRIRCCTSHYLVLNFQAAISLDSSSDLTSQGDFKNQQGKGYHSRAQKHHV